MGVIGLPFRYPGALLRLPALRRDADDKSHIKRIQACIEPPRRADGPSSTVAYFTRATGRGVIMQSGGRRERHCH